MINSPWESEIRETEECTCNSGELKEATHRNCCSTTILESGTSRRDIPSLVHTTCSVVSENAERLLQWPRSPEARLADVARGADSRRCRSDGRTGAGLAHRSADAEHRRRSRSQLDDPRRVVRVSVRQRRTGAQLGPSARPDRETVWTRCPRKQTQSKAFLASVLVTPR